MISEFKLITLFIRGYFLSMIVKGDYLIANGIPAYSKLKAVYYLSCVSPIRKLPEEVRSGIEKWYEVGEFIVDLYEGADVEEINIPHYFYKLSPLDIRIIKSLKQIPKGKVASYIYLAKKLGIHPRRVARALAKNPFPLIYPCHRVVYSDGSLGGYLGKLSLAGLKAEILRREGVMIIGERVPSKYFLHA